MERYDVIVAGAGPAGGNCARELAKMGYAVLLVERSKTIGEPNFSTAGTVRETMKVFNLPRRIADSSWSSFLVEGPTQKAEFAYKKTMGYVLNFKLLKQFLVNKAKKKGVDVIVGASVEDVLINNKCVNGVVIVNESGGKEKLSSKIVVDATGASSILSRKLGLTKPRNSVTGIEYRMKKVFLECPDRLNFYLNRNYAPNGYAWIFPSGRNSAKVGVGIIKPTRYKKPLLGFLKRFVASNRQTRLAKIIELHGWSLYSDVNIKNYVKDGFISIGDAASQINPLGGEGIRHGLYSGLFAAQTIDLALRNNDTSEKSLQLYNRKWKDYVGNKWLISSILAKIVYSLNNRGLDAGIETASKFDPQDVFDIVFNYRFGIVKKYLPQIFKRFPKHLFNLGLSSRLF